VSTGGHSRFESKGVSDVHDANTLFVRLRNLAGKPELAAEFPGF
jgi:hypothetical protein